MGFAPPSATQGISNVSARSGIGGSGAGKTPLSIGDVVFATQECPNKLSIGAAEQMLAVHDMPGGSRVVNAFGNKFKDVTWEGHFWDQNISIRVQQLRLYQVSGVEIPVSFGDEKYYCIVKDFDPGYLGGYNEYSITLCITRDNNGQFTVASSTSIDTQVQALQSAAIAQNVAVQAVDPTQSGGFQSALTNLWAVIAAAQPLAQNIVSGGQGILQAAATAIEAVQTYQALVGEVAQQYPNVVALISALQLITDNVSRGQSPQSVAVIGGDLFGIAAMQYGDVTQAFSLAAANGLISPYLPSGIPRNVRLPIAQPLSQPFIPRLAS